MGVSVVDVSGNVCDSADVHLEAKGEYWVFYTIVFFFIYVGHNLSLISH